MKCCGCGVKLQFTDKDKIGFTPISDAESYSEDIYCERCFKIIHHSIDYSPALTNQDYYNKIDTLKDKKCLIILLVDAMNIPSSFIPNLKVHIKENPVLILINKTDVLPKDLTLNYIETFTKSIASKEGLNVVGTMFISSIKGTNIDKVIAKIEKVKYNYFKKFKKVITDSYVLGSASTGKSTFINKLKKLYNKNTKDLTTSLVFQTTLDFIKVNLDKNVYIFDTPGYINYHSFGAYLLKNSLEVITPRTYLRPKTYQLKDGQTIFLGALCSLSFESDEKFNVSCYISNEVYVHRTKTENADELYNNNKVTLLKPPMTLDEVEKLEDFKVTTYTINGKKDLWISGLGFIHLVGNFKVRVKIFKEIGLTITDAII